MNALQFIASIISSLAWPATVVFLVLYFKHPITKLILSLKNLKIGDMQANFHQDVKNLEVIADSVSLPVLNPKQAVASKKVEYNLVDLSKSSPVGAVVLAWINVEAEIDKTIDELRLSPDINVRRSPRQSIDILAHQEYFNSNILGMLQGLRQTRNSVTHAKPGTIQINEDDVLNYINLSERVIYYLRTLREQKRVSKK